MTRSCANLSSSMTAAIPAALCAAVVTMSAQSAFAQESAGVSVRAQSGDSVTVDLTNPFDFELRVVGIRLLCDNDDGSATIYESAGGDIAMLAPAQAAGTGWSGDVTVAKRDDDTPSHNDLTACRGAAAAGVDLDATAELVDTAIRSGSIESLSAALTQVRNRARPISRASRHHPEQVAASGIEEADWFSLERVDALRAQVEATICENASRRFLAARGQSRRQELYTVLAEQVREADLHITCMNPAASLAAAQMLIASNRPQDAVAFAGRDEEGQLLPEWRPIFVQSRIAFAQSAISLNANTFNAYRPVLEAMRDVHQVAPDHQALAEAADTIFPRVRDWINTAIAQGELDDAQRLIEIMRPTFSDHPAVAEAAGAYATALLNEGLRHAREGRYRPARNRFVRGNNLLEGVPEWDNHRDEINHVRALGVLDDGREIASNASDDSAPARGHAKLAEAQEMFDLTEAEIALFNADIAESWVAVAHSELEEHSFVGARTALERAEGLSPTGPSESIQNAWLDYAEARHSRGGFFMSGDDVADAREAIERAGDVDPDRASKIGSRLTMAFYGYRVGIPAVGVLILLLIGIGTIASRRRARKYSMLAND